MLFKVWANEGKDSLRLLEEIEAADFTEASRTARTRHSGSLHIADGHFAIDLPEDRMEIPRELVEFIEKNLAERDNEDG